MRIARQEYIDGTLEDALAAGCDMVQLKYDGWWSRHEVVVGAGKVYSETNRELEKFEFKLEQTRSMVVVGELMYGTQWARDPGRYGKVYLFDIWNLEGVDLEDLNYRQRYGTLSKMCAFLPPNYELVQNFRITDYKTLWDRFVETEMYEGVVFRNSRDAVGKKIVRQKFSITEDVQVRGFKPGNGKFEGMLGSLLCINEQDVLIEVGGGFDDEERKEIWTNQDNYLNRWCQIEGRKRFQSGALRHPNFVSWRPMGWNP